MHANMAAPATEKRLEEIARGERVTLLARDGAEVDALRARAQAHAARMSGGQCAEAGKAGAEKKKPNAERTPEGEI
jgi:hypothetical protein